MVLYFGGGKKLKINMNNVAYRLNTFWGSPIINGIGLLSSEDYILKGSDGLYLIVKEDG